jgi:hypothetical protein
MLIHLQAALLFLPLGPSRLSALTLNFGYFALLQVVLASTLFWFSRRWSVAFLGVGLLLTAATPFIPWGGMMDFRLDFITCCLYGMVLCLVLRSGVFASRRWSLLTGALGGLCVLFRFLTLTYLAGVFGALFAFYAVRWLRARVVERPETVHRLGNLLLAGLLLIGVAGPGIWRNCAGLLTHYVEHIRCGESEIVGKLYGASTLWQRAGFYATSVARDHAGAPFGLAATLALLGSLAPAACRLARPVQDRPGLPVDRPATGAAVILGILVPLAALIVYPSPSPVVAGVVVPGLVLAGVFAAALLAGAPRGRDSRVASLVLAALATGAVSGGLGLYFHQLGQRSSAGLHPDNEAELLRVYDVIAGRCRQTGLKAPRIFEDNISDTLYPYVMRPAIYERHGVLLRPLNLRGCVAPSLLAMSDQETLDCLRKSDFVILTTGTAFPEGQPYPFDRSIQQLRPRLKEVCEAEFTPLGPFHIYGRDVMIYERPTLVAARQ